MSKRAIQVNMTKRKYRSEIPSIEYLINTEGHSLAESCRILQISCRQFRKHIKPRQLQRILKLARNRPKTRTPRRATIMRYQEQFPDLLSMVQNGTKLSAACDLLGIDWKTMNLCLTPVQLWEVRSYSAIIGNPSVEDIQAKYYELKKVS